MKKTSTIDTRALIITLLIKAIIIIILLFVFLPAPEIKWPSPYGIIVNFGMDDNGLGNIEPQSESQKPDKVTTVEKMIKQEKAILTQDFDKTIPAIDKKELAKKEEKVLEKTVEKPREVKTSALFTNNPNNGSTSQGITSGDGNQGKIFGEPGAEAYEGNKFQGNGSVDFKMEGRDPIGNLPIPDYPPGNISGTVVVEIKIDKNGNVVRVRETIGTTTTSEELISAAKIAAWKAKFSPNPTQVEQIGIIRYKFQLR